MAGCMLAARTLSATRHDGADDAPEKVTAGLHLASAGESCKLVILHYCLTQISMALTFAVPVFR